MLRLKLKAYYYFVLVAFILLVNIALLIPSFILSIVDLVHERIDSIENKLNDYISRKISELKEEIKASKK